LELSARSPRIVRAEVRSRKRGVTDKDGDMALTLEGGTITGKGPDGLKLKLIKRK
jgi:hypothetical protein